MKTIKKYIDYCQNCNAICKKEEISEGVYGCGHCKNIYRIKTIDVTDYIYIK